MRLILISLSFTIAHSAFSQFTETIPVTNSLLQIIKSIVTADFNNDGHKDIITSSVVDGKIAFFKNNGNLSFEEPITVYQQEEFYGDLEAVDIDNDGDQDLLVFRSNGVDILRNNGVTSFAKENILSGATQITSFSVADFDNDDDPDIVLGYDASSVVLFRNVNGSFLSPETVYSNFSASPIIRSADLNLDGNVDMVIGLHPYLRYFQGNGNGTFAASVQLTNMEAVEIQIADYDADGDADIFSGGNQLTVFTNDGNGIFTSSLAVNETGSYGLIRFADRNLDGYPELFFCTNYRIECMENISGNLQPPVDVAGGVGDPAIYHYLPSDMNNDGFPEMLFPYSFSNGFNDLFLLLRNEAGLFSEFQNLNAILHNSSVLLCDDMNGDGFKDIAVSSNMLTWFPNTGADAFGKQHIHYATLGKNNQFSALADFDADGDTDYINSYSNYAQPGYQIEFHENDGTGNFSEPVLLGNGPQLVYQLFTTDLNNDAKPDIVYTFLNQTESGFKWLKNNGNNSFADPENIYLTNMTEDGLSRPFVTDANDDGFNDLIGRATQNGSLITNNGDGSFSAPIIIPGFGRRDNVLVSDLDNDGFEDIIADTNHHNLQWLKNNGSGSYTTYNIGNFPFENIFSLEVSDVDLDGDIDIVSVADWKIFYFENVGNGNFAERIEIETEIEAATVTLSDLTQDGYPELLVTGRKENGEVLYWAKNIYEYLSTAENQKVWITFYPNPVTGKTISIKGIHGEKATVEVYSMEGKLVDSFNNMKVSTPIPLDQVPAGSYIIRISEETGNSWSEKIIIQ